MADMKTLPFGTKVRIKPLPQYIKDRRLDNVIGVTCNAYDNEYGYQVELPEGCQWANGMVRFVWVKAHQIEEVTE